MKKTKQSQNKAHNKQEQTPLHRPEHLDVSNNWLYYGTILDRFIFQGLGATIFFNLNFFIDSIGNEYNNNWTPEEKQTNLAIQTCLYYLGSTIGALCAGFMTRTNTRNTFLALRVCYLVSALMITSNSIWVVVFGRFLSGFFFDSAMEVNIWSLYEILLPRHTEKVLTLFYFTHSITYFCTSLAAIYDDGSYWYWRVVYLVPQSLIVVFAILSYFLIPYVNSVTYLMLSRTEEEVLEVMELYYEPETARYIIEKYKRDYKQALDFLNPTKEFIKREEKSALEADLVPKKPQKSHQSHLESFFRDAKIYDKEVTHIALFSLTSMMCFNDAFYQFSLYFGAKSLDDKQAVESTKEWLLFSTICKAISCFIVGAMGLSKRRRATLLTSHALSLIFISMICVSFFVEDLSLSRIAVGFAPISTAGLYTVNYIYANDVCPPSLFSINHLLVRGTPTVYGLLLPLFLDFEGLSYQGVALRLLLLVTIGWLCFFGCLGI